MYLSGTIQMNKMCQIQKLKQNKTKKNMSGFSQLWNDKPGVHILSMEAPEDSHFEKHIQWVPVVEHRKNLWPIIIFYIGCLLVNEAWMLMATDEWWISRTDNWLFAAKACCYWSVTRHQARGGESIQSWRLYMGRITTELIWGDAKDRKLTYWRINLNIGGG